MKNRFTLTLLLAACIAATGAQAQMKVIASTLQIRTNGTPETRDSTNYFYTGTRGAAAPKYPIPEYESGIDSSFTHSLSSGSMVLSGKEIHHYNGTNIDTIIKYKIDNGSWENDERIVLEYSAGYPDTVTTYTWGTFGGNSSWRQSSRMIYTWSGSKIATSTYQTRSFGGGGGGGSSWRNRRMSTITGTSPRVEVIARWASSGGGGGGSWEDSVRITSTFTGANLTQQDSEKWNVGNTSWDAGTRAFYSYDGSSRLDLMLSELYNGTAWENDDSVDYFYTGASKTPDSIIYAANQFGLYVLQSKHEIVANSAGQWVIQRIIASDGNGFPNTDGDTTNNWYYGWNVGVNDIDAERVSLLSIYPTPASNNITIELNDGMKNKDVQFSILDMQGRTLRTWAETYQSASTVSVVELPAGNYILHARSGNVVVAERFVLSK